MCKIGGLTRFTTQAQTVLNAFSVLHLRFASSSSSRVLLRLCQPLSLSYFKSLLVIGLSRLVELGFRWLCQPLVIGEIVAGIMLGSSLFGLVAPGLSAALFPPETVPSLNVLSQIGLIFFVFLIGLDLNPKYLQGQIQTAILTSHVSIVVPFSLGTILAVLLYPQVSNADVSFTAFALFLGAAMSITAFPVLARIITENNLQGTRLEALALTCAVVDDVTAWCLLAMAIAVTRTNSIVAALSTLLASVFYIGFVLTLGRSFLQRLSKYYDRTEKANTVCPGWDLHGCGSFGGKLRYCV